MENELPQRGRKEFNARDKKQEKRIEKQSNLYDLRVPI